MTFCHGTFFSASEIEKEVIFQREIAIDIFGENEEYKETININGPIRITYWSPAWIPFFYTDLSTVCLDLDPAEGGVIGQVIEIN